MSEKKQMISASPKVRKFARELGADIHQIHGSQREGRVSENDVKSFIKESLSGETPKKQTIAFWFKIGTDLETTRRLFMAGDSTDEGGFWLWLDADDKLRVYLVTTGAAATRFDAPSSMKFRDPAAWYHLCATWDTTLSSPFFKVFINKVLQISIGFPLKISRKTLYDQNICRLP